MSPTFVNDHQYQLTATATDNSQLSAAATLTFIYDVQKPTSSITSPPAGYFTAAPLTTISGLASDQTGNPINPAGISASSVTVAIQKVGGNWWNGATFSAINPAYSTAAFTGASSGTWTWAVPVALQNALVSGSTYFIVSRSTDNAGNSEFGPLNGNIPGGVGVTIFYDTAPPTSVFTVPAYSALAQKYFNALPSVSGTASGDTGIQSVQFAVVKLGAPSLWFDGTAFTKDQPLPYFLPVTGTTVWSAPSLANLVTYLQNSGDHAQYVFVTSATAPSGLTQATFAVGTSSFTLTYDQTAPTAVIGVPASNNSTFKRANIGESGANLFSGSSSDLGPLASGVEEVDIQVSYLSGSDTYYWTGAAFSSTTVAWPSMATNNLWLYGTSIVWPNDGLSHAITLKARAIDYTKAADNSGTGNTDVPVTAGTDVMNFTIDDNPPSGTIVWPGPSAAISSATVQIAGTETDVSGDPAGSGVNTVQVEISTGTGGSKSCLNGTTWSAPGCVNGFVSTTTANPWFYTIPNAALAPANGSYIYLRTQLVDFAGNSFTTPITTFTYNTTAPTVTMSPQPPNNGLYSAVQVSTPFAGTTSPSGAPNVVVSTVILTLQDLTVGTSYYNGSSWVTGATTFPAQGTAGSWTFNNAALTFVNDHKYQLTATATDNSHLSAAASFTFVYDVVPPTSTISSPASPYMTALNIVNGIVTDNPNGTTFNDAAGVSTSGVTVAVQLIGGKWWNGTDFNTTSNPFYFTVVNTTTTFPLWKNNWSYTVPAGLQSAILSGSQYRFISRATDIANNVEYPANSVPAGVGETVLYDSAPPVSVITFPTNNLDYQSIPAITGTANDTLTGSGVQEVDIALVDVINRYWAGPITGWTGNCRYLQLQLDLSALYPRQR